MTHLGSGVCIAAVEMVLIFFWRALSNLGYRDQTPTSMNTRPGWLSKK
jgi:hypothetical protein